MEYNYEVGQQFELPVVGKGINTNDMPYLEVYHNESNRYFRIFNLLKFQYEFPPKTMYVKVSKVDSFGKVFQTQDLERLFRDLYKIGKMYIFQVKDKKKDSNTNKEYLELEDDNFVHRWYAPNPDEYKIGEGCILEIEGFTPKGYLKLTKVKHEFSDDDIEKIDIDLESEGSEIPAQGVPVLEGVEECETIELKSSIVYPAGGNHKADIVTQLKKIVMAIVSMMNAKGGSLYIGVRDRNKEICGIQGDYNHLNDNPDNDYDDYKPDRDGFELKIRHAIERSCQGVAGLLISFNFLSQEGREYCRIDITPAKRPIWIDGKLLYVRQGNKNKLLKGDDITTFITSRTTLLLREIIDTDDFYIPQIIIDQKKLEEAIKSMINSVPKDLPKKITQGKISYWITWFNDKTWRKSRNQIDSEEKAFEISVPDNSKNRFIVFCYPSGNINTMKLNDFMKGATMKNVKTNGWSRTNEKPSAILLMGQNEYIVGYGRDSHGSYVKLHAITDFNPTQSALNQGSRFVPQDGVVETYAHLGPEASLLFPNLIVGGPQKTSNMGVPLNSITYSQEIKQLEEKLTK